MKVVFDESGNTGQNLIDINQRYFVLASIKFSDKEVEKYHDLLKGNAEELHFVNMKKYASSRKKIIEFLNSDVISNDKVKFSITDKRYSIMCRLTDLLISEGALKEGVDIFKNGLYFIINWTFIERCIANKDDGLLDEILNMFVKIIREKNISLKNEFYSLVKQLEIINSDKNDKMIADYLLKSESEFEKVISNTDKYTLDPTFGSFLVLADLWSKEIEGQYEVIYDKSKQMEYWKPRVDFLSENSILIDDIDTINLKFPLKQDSFTISSSLDFIRIQLADIVASSVNFAMNKNHSKNEYTKFADSILGSKIFRLHFHSVKRVKNPNEKSNEFESQIIRENFRKLIEIFDF